MVPDRLLPRLRSARAGKITPSCRVRHDPVAETPLRLLVTPPILLLLAGTVGLTGWLLIRNGLKAADEITVELSREVGSRVEDYLVSYLGEAHLVNDLNADAVLQGELGDWGSDSLKSPLLAPTPALRAPELRLPRHPPRWGGGCRSSR